MALNPHKRLSALAAFLPSVLFGKPAARGYSSDKEHRFATSAFAFLAVLSLFFTGEAKAQPEAFIITVKTDNPGSSNSRSFTIPTTGTGYNYEVDWDDDGIYDQMGITGNVIHNYGTAGTYTLRIRGTFPRIYFNSSEDCKKILDVNQWGNNTWTSMENAFLGCSNLNITATDLPNLGRVRDMTSMFADCTVLNGPGNIGDWNTRSVTNMSSLFRNARNFNQPIGNWNTAATTTMRFMFRGAEAFNQPIGDWNTSKVTDMLGMFFGARAFNQPLENWNTANVTDMGGLFYNARVFNQPLEAWNTSKVIYMNDMFAYTDSFNQPIGNWDTKNVGSMYNMFYNAAAFNQPIGNWSTAKVIEMNRMFWNAAAFNQPIGNWNTANVLTMDAMFRNATAFNQPIGTWRLNPAVKMQLMLSDCGMDCANYSATLNGWANNPAIPSGRWLDAKDRYYGTDAVAARAILVENKGWKIVGDVAHDAPCPFTSSTATAPVDEGSVVLSPNPADKEVYIRLITPNPSTNQLTAPSIAIFDMQGRLVWKQQEATTPEQTLRVAVSDWTPGVYIVALRGEGTPVLKRLVVLE